jgi:hypothetical protein
MIDRLHAHSRLITVIIILIKRGVLRVEAVKKAEDQALSSTINSRSAKVQIGELYSEL